MLFFGHVGITLGAAVLIKGLTRRRGHGIENKVSKDSGASKGPLQRGATKNENLGLLTTPHPVSSTGQALNPLSQGERRRRSIFEQPSPSLAGGLHSEQGGALHPPYTWLESLGKLIDIRLLIIGSLLPDIIDKPTGMLFFRTTFYNGRIFSHTVLFFFVVLLAGLYAYRYHRRTWILALAAGTFFHLILDEMWWNPHTLLWPFYGWVFPKDISGTATWFSDLLYGFLNNPTVYVSEAIGLVITLWFALVLFRQKKIVSFLKRGRL